MPIRNVCDVFHYKVEIGEKLCGFTEISIKTNSEVSVPLALGGDPSQKQMGQGAGHLILRRGLCPADILAWWKKVEKGRMELRDTHVFLTDPRHKPVASWYFFNTCPLAFEGTLLTEGETEIACEQLILTYDKMHFHPLVSKE